MSAAPKLTHDYITGKIEELPTLPTIVYELTQIINDPLSSTTDVEKVMANDQSLTTKVLKLINSPYYAIPGGVSSLSRAVTYLGFDTVNQLVLSSSIVDALATTGPSEFDINEFWKHAVGVAIASETIAKITKYPTPADLFTCGLVHDMGKIALLTIAPDTLIEVSKKANAEGTTFLEAEKSLEVPDHTLIGKMLSEKWKLPGQIQGVIKHHHQLNVNLRGPLSPEMNQAVDIVLLGNLLVHALKFGNSGHSKIVGVPKEVMQRLGIDPKTQFKPLAAKVKANLETATDLINMICNG